MSNFRPAGESAYGRSGETLRDAGETACATTLQIPVATQVGRAFSLPIGRVSNEVSTAQNELSVYIAHAGPFRWDAGLIPTAVTTRVVEVPLSF